MTDSTAAAGFDAALEQVLSHAPAASDERAARLALFEMFRELGWPRRTDEEWRFTPTAPIAETIWHSPAPGAPAPECPPIPGLPEPNAMACNGAVSVAQRADREGVSVSCGPADIAPLRSRPGEPLPDAFDALNGALHPGVLHIVASAGSSLEAPVHVATATSATDMATAVHTRIEVVVHAGASLTLVETFNAAGAKPTFTNAAAAIHVEEGARLEHVRIGLHGAEAAFVGRVSLELGPRSWYRQHNLVLGGALTRNDVRAWMGGEHAECTLNGLYHANGRRVVDNHTSITHAVPNCLSHELYKGIIDDDARGVFNGRIHVLQDAQKTDAKQTNKTLLRSPGARINTKPQLEIYADDVRCTHGATVGQLSADAVYYLRTRGIGVEQARNILTHAFGADVIEAIPDARLRAYAAGLFTSALDGTLSP